MHPSPPRFRQGAQHATSLGFCCASQAGVRLPTADLEYSEPWTPAWDAQQKPKLVVAARPAETRGVMACMDARAFQVCGGAPREFSRARGGRAARP